MTRWVMALWLLLSAAPALADELRPVSIHFVEQAEGRWTLDWKQPLAAPGAGSDAIPQLPEQCSASAVRRERVTGAVLGHADVVCSAMEGPNPNPVTIGWRGFAAGGGEAILRVAPLGRPVQIFRLTPSLPSATLRPRASRWQVWRSYFAIGVEHILTGWDHLLFVIALVLLIGRGWAVVKAATAFTLAHSLTLAAVTLGVAGLPQRPVEALIALSILFLAVEIARGNGPTLTRRLPWLVAFAFGLLHGFGFAGALRDIGLPEGEVPAALISFNLGVEAGQIAVIACILALLALVRRLRPRLEAPLVRAAAYAIGIAGAYWLFDRLIG